MSFVSISPTTASPGDEVTVTVSMSDATGVTGDYHAQVWILHGETSAMGTDQVQLMDWVLLSGDTTNGTYEVTLTVNNVAGGVFDIVVVARDDLSNYTTERLYDAFTLEGS